MRNKSRPQSGSDRSRADINWTNNCVADTQAVVDGWVGGQVVDGGPRWWGHCTDHPSERAQIRSRSKPPSDTLLQNVRLLCVFNQQAAAMS